MGNHINPSKMQFFGNESHDGPMTQENSNEFEHLDLFNKSGENLFCRTNTLSKKNFLEKWKSLKNEVKFSIGKINIKNERTFIQLMQNSNIMCSCMRTEGTEKTFFYFSCTTKDNCVIIFEMQLLKKDNFYAEVKYKSETNSKELHFENFIMMILTDNLINSESECVCR